MTWNAAHRDRLRHRPEVGAGAASVLARLVDLQREVRDRAPEVHEGEAVRRAAVGEAPVVDLDRPVDVDVIGGGAESGDLGVVADLELQRGLGGAVVTGKEVDGVPAAAHLVVALLIGERVERALDLGQGSVGAEDLNVGAEVRVERIDRSRWCRVRRRGDERARDESDTGRCGGESSGSGAEVGGFVRGHAKVLSVEKQPAAGAPRYLQDCNHSWERFQGSVAARCIRLSAVGARRGVRRRGSRSVLCRRGAGCGRDRHGGVG